MLSTLQGDVDELDQVQQWDGSPPPSALADAPARGSRRASHRAHPDAGGRAASPLAPPGGPGDRPGAPASRRGIGVNSACGNASLAGDFQTPKQVGALAGLTPTPYQSGQSRRELGSPKRAIGISGPWRLRSPGPAPLPAGLFSS